MAAVTLKQLLEAGVHFGHQTRRWNPRMRPYIHGEKSGIYIIDLLQTRELLQEACDFVNRLGREGRSLLFVGTKKQAQEAVAEEAVRSGMFFVNQRWLGGMLTNFSTIQTRIKRLRELEKMREDGLFEVLPKKEVAEKEREIAKLVRSLGGIKNMHRLPDAVFIIDPKKEHLAVREARKLGIPIVALVDTNCDPDEIDFVIPANDDAIKAIRLLLGAVADSILEGRKEGAASQKEAAPVSEEVAAVS